MEGLRCVVLGAASKHSIAFQTARSWVGEGARVVVGCQSSRLAASISRLPMAGKGQSLTLPCDVRHDEEVGALMEQAGEWLGGGIDVVVHSVAYASPEAMSGGVLGASQRDMADAMQVSALSLVSLAQHAVKWMPAREALAEEEPAQASPSLIAVSFLGGSRVFPNYSVMGPCKAALEALTRSLAAELGPRGIRCNCVSPGPLHTLAARGITGFRDLAREWEEGSPLKEDGDTMAATVQAMGYLATAKGVTGQVLHVDRGYSIMG